MFARRPWRRGAGDRPSLAPPEALRCTFQLLGEVSDVEVIARGRGIRKIARLRRAYGGRHWRKLKGTAVVGLRVGLYDGSSCTGMRRTGSAGPSRIGAQLGVSAVVEGSVRRAGNRVRISAELVDVEGGFQLWAERFDRELVDTFEVQEEIANAVADALRRHLGLRDFASRAEDTPSAQPRVDPAAYEAHLRGLHVIRNQLVGGGIPDGIRELERSVALDPRFARAWSALGGAYYSSAIYTLRKSRDVFPKALQALHTAVALDDKLGEPRALLGYVGLMYEWDWDGAAAHFEQALTLAPDDSVVLGRAALYAVSLARFDWMEQLVDRMLGADPMSVYAHYIAGVALGTSLHDARAIELFEAALRINPTHGESLRFLAISYLRTGRIDDAERAFERVLALTNRHSWAVADRVS